MVNKLRADGVWANACNKFDPTSPFGSYEESGSRLRPATALQVGREGGLQGLAAYCRVD
jgi:aldehyde dehydrogenase (NAD+)